MILTGEVLEFLLKYKQILCNFYTDVAYDRIINESINSFMNFRSNEHIFAIFVINTHANVEIYKESPVTGDNVKQKIIFPGNNMAIELENITELYDANNKYFCIITTHGKVLKNYIVDYTDVSYSNIEDVLNYISNCFSNTSSNYNLNVNNCVKQYNIVIDDMEYDCLHFVDHYMNITNDISELIKLFAINIDCAMKILKKKIESDKKTIICYTEELNSKNNEMEILSKTIETKNKEIQYLLKINKYIKNTCIALFSIIATFGLLY